MRLKIIFTCHTGSLCLPDLAVERSIGTVPFSCKLYTATVPIIDNHCVYMKYNV